MKTYTTIQTEAVSAITCDRCQVSFTEADDDWYEMVSIEFAAGYGNIFGDGNRVAIDLCQHCLKQTLGPYLRINENGPVSADLVDALRQSADIAGAEVEGMISTVDDANRRSERMEPAAESEPTQNLPGVADVLANTARTLDTGSSHITPVGANIFLELGFPPAEAEAMKAESDRIIDAKLAAKHLAEIEAMDGTAGDGLQGAPTYERDGGPLTQADLDEIQREAAKHVPDGQLQSKKSLL